MKGFCMKDHEPTVRVRGWNSTRGKSTKVHWVQRTLCTQSRQCRTEQNTLRSDSWVENMINPALLPKINLLVPLWESNMIILKKKSLIKLYIRGSSSMYILTVMKKCWPLLSFFFSFVAFQKVQWGTVHHKAIFRQSPSITFICFLDNGMLNTTHTPQHTSITVHMLQCLLYI